MKPIPRFDLCMHCHNPPEMHVYTEEIFGKSFLEAIEMQKTLKCETDKPTVYACDHKCKIAQRIRDTAMLDLINLGSPDPVVGMPDPPYPTLPQIALIKEKRSAGEVDPLLVFADENMWEFFHNLIPPFFWKVRRLPEAILGHTRPWEQQPGLAARDLTIFCRPNQEHMEVVMKCIHQHSAERGLQFKYHVVYVPESLASDKTVYDKVWNNLQARNNIHFHNFPHAFTPLEYDLFNMDLPFLQRDTSIINTEPLHWVRLLL